jgi:hypothetical protein
MSLRQRRCEVSVDKQETLRMLNEISEDVAEMKHYLDGGFHSAAWRRGLALLSKVIRFEAMISEVIFDGR